MKTRRHRRKVKKTMRRKRGGWRDRLINAANVDNSWSN
jgi:hypothetical protein